MTTHLLQGILPGSENLSPRLVFPTMKSRITHAVWRICAVVLLSLAASAPAQSIHKEVDSEGHITFTDRTETTALPQATTAQGSELAAALARRGLMNSKDAATVDDNEATRRLARARQNRSAGTAQRPGDAADGDLVGKLNRYYLQDKKKQECEVAAAQKRSNKTSTDRSALLRSDDRIDPHDTDASR